ncbi:arf-GAP with coiled-coil, ANK repeat and PH domain-containing protein 2-like isoform X1 [Apostichopus japonicus]|uniref:arf-GAP with coiled-coil, ANK repeat and PH domain-containing protein 2-like isoform X1 n=1 Tax=Stichopus japonicus TaxID=307972 RepID=UPI003AB784B8
MKHKIDFEECMKDSPSFRLSIENAEIRIHDLEAGMEKLVKTSKEMTDAGKIYNANFGNFITSVKDLTVYFNEDTFVMGNVMKFVQVLSDLKSYHVMLEDQIGRAVSTVLNNFVKKDIKRVKDTKKYFDKITEELDTALNKNAQIIKAKPQEAEESRKLVLATRSAFGVTAFDYSLQINELQSKERQDVLNTLMSFMNAQYTFFHQGFDLLKDLQPTCKGLGNKIQNMNERAQAESKEMEGRRSMIPKIEEFWEIAFDGTKIPVTMEGYLYKRATNAFKTWNRRWFTIKNNQLIYQKRSKGIITIAAEDLRLCNVKPFEEIERRFCFEVVSPGKTIVLQADSEQIRHSWIQAMQAGINSAFNLMSPRPSSVSQSSLETVGSSLHDKPGEDEECKKQSFRSKIQLLPGNEKCADCKQDQATWACINFGITVCIACSGVHRSMGVHLSKVRSLTLDKWEPETAKVMLELGNAKINQIYEGKVDESIAQPAIPHCSNAMREKWIRAKYQHKHFVCKESSIFTEKRNRFRRFKENKKQRSSRRKAKEKEKENATVKTAVSEDSGLGGSTDQIPSSPELPRNLEEELLDIVQTGFATSDSSDAEYMDDSPTNGETPSFSPQQNLYIAAASGLLPQMCECLAQGANVNEMDDNDKMRTPLHKAVTSCSLTAVEYLLLNGAKVNVPDQNCQTVLHLATQLGNTGMVCLLLKRGADQTAKDVDGQDPIMIAITTTNADIVTLLRLARLNEEIRETEMHPGDETMTFQEVFRDFTDLACDSPEKLHRNSQGKDDPV